MEFEMYKRINFSLLVIHMQNHVAKINHLQLMDSSDFFLFKELLIFFIVRILIFSFFLMKHFNTVFPKKDDDES